MSLRSILTWSRTKVTLKNKYGYGKDKIKEIVLVRVAGGDAGVCGELFGR